VNQLCLCLRANPYLRSNYVSDGLVRICATLIWVVNGSMSPVAGLIRFAVFHHAKATAARLTSQPVPRPYFHLHEGGISEPLKSLSQGSTSAVTCTLPRVLRQASNVSTEAAVQDRLPHSPYTSSMFSPFSPTEGRSYDRRDHQLGSTVC
jgi:hypothetical protein